MHAWPRVRTTLAAGRAGRTGGLARRRGKAGARRVQLSSRATPTLEYPWRHELHRLESHQPPGWAIHTHDLTPFPALWIAPFGCRPKGRGGRTACRTPFHYPAGLDRSCACTRRRRTEWRRRTDEPCQEIGTACTGCEITKDLKSSSADAAASCLQPCSPQKHAEALDCHSASSRLRIPQSSSRGIGGATRRVQSASLDRRERGGGDGPVATSAMPRLVGSTSAFRDHPRPHIE